MIRYYDIMVEAEREATQEDWDLLYKRVVRLKVENDRLKEEITAVRSQMAQRLGTRSDYTDRDSAKAMELLHRNG